MKIKEITYRNRFDFKAIFQCEHCNYEFKQWGYDDKNYHDNVIPNAICPKCGLNSHNETESELEARTGRKYRI